MFLFLWNKMKFVCFYSSQNFNIKIINRIISRDCNLRSRSYQGHFIIKTTVVSKMKAFLSTVRPNICKSIYFIFAAFYKFFFSQYWIFLVRKGKGFEEWNKSKGHEKWKEREEKENEWVKYWYIWLFEWKIRLFCVHVMHIGIAWMLLHW